MVAACTLLIHVCIFECCHLECTDIYDGYHMHCTNIQYLMVAISSILLDQMVATY
jgi:hypothetical protein